MSAPSTSQEGLSIVKFGGSVITRKHQAERLRPKILARLATEIAEAPGPLVLLHGAGSFGHPGAVRFGLASAPGGSDTAAHRSRGAAIVATEVRRLHLAVLQALVRAGASPASVPPSTLCENRAGKLARFDATAFEKVLAGGQLAVSFGDVVPDVEWGHSILSADTIAAELSRSLPVRRVVFVSDVPGVLDPDGGDRPKVVPAVDRALVDRLRTSARGPDVTGGIRGKTLAMLEIAATGADAGLISGLRAGALGEAVRGQAAGGSWVWGAGR